MDAQFIHHGFTIDYTPSSNVAAGDVIVQGDLVGVALLDIPANKKGALAVEGVFDFAKASGSAIAAGTVCYWNTTSKVAQSTAGSYKKIGKSIQSASSADTLVRIKLDQ